MNRVKESQDFNAFRSRMLYSEERLNFWSVSLLQGANELTRDSWQLALVKTSINVRESLARIGRAYSFGLPNFCSWVGRLARSGLIVGYPTNLTSTSWTNLHDHYTQMTATRNASLLAKANTVLPTHLQSSLSNNINQVPLGHHHSTQTSARDTSRLSWQSHQYCSPASKKQ